MRSTVYCETIVNILQEAGFLLLARDEVANVSGNVITTSYPNIVASNPNVDDAIPKPKDVIVTVNGEDVALSSVDGETGRITLTEAPEEGAIVKVTYHYSPVSLAFARIARDDAQNIADSKLRDVGGCAKLCSGGSIPSRLRLIVRLYAGGLLLIKDYGYNTDIENTSKDGYRKMQEAKSLLSEYATELEESCGQSEVDGGAAAIETCADGNMFQRPDKAWRHCGDQAFWENTHEGY